MEERANIYICMRTRGPVRIAAVARRQCALRTGPSPPELTSGGIVAAVAGNRASVLRRTGTVLVSPGEISIPLAHDVVRIAATRLCYYHVCTCHFSHVRVVPRLAFSDDCDLEST